MGRSEGFSFTNSQVILLEYILILGFSIFPVFMHFPYRINIYLSWEGAYRLYLGQIPYKDFGLPMGFGYWIIPALFFKLFGPSMITLVKAQAFINIISAFAFLSILKSLDVKPAIRFLSLFLYLISFSFVNFWPWYNHSVIVFEFIGIAFLLQYIFKKENKWRRVWLFLSSFFLFLSFFTKQDAGAFAFLIGLSLVICNALYEKRIVSVWWFLAFYVIIALCVFIPFVPYHIGYWFNYGQPPHYDRVSFYDILDIFFGKSEWIKFYAAVMVLIWILKFKHFRDALQDKKFIFFSILAAGILFEAAVFQVTSYIPEFNNIFFHSFAIAYIFSYSGLPEKINFKKPFPLFITAFLIFIWWSSRSWQYTNRIIGKFFPKAEAVDTNEVSIRTFELAINASASSDETGPKMSAWVSPPWKPFEGVYLPESDVDGIKKLLALPMVANNGRHLKVLNMSELTPLAAIIGYKPETGPDIPMWYHRNVAMFEKQIGEYDQKIKNNYYDLILFEYIPILNNFFPFQIRDTLQKYYQQINKFASPRRDGSGDIEVYIRKSDP